MGSSSKGAVHRISFGLFTSGDLIGQIHEVCILVDEGSVPIVIIYYFSSIDS